MKVAALLLSVATGCFLPATWGCSLGCGCGPGPIDPGRLAVTGTLKEACAAAGRTDEEIKARIDAVEAARLDGCIRQDAIDSIPANCTGQGVNADDCAACEAAIINQVYGQ